MFKQVLAASAFVAGSLAGYSNDTVVTTDVTVTDYTTYCPYSTVVTVTKCEDVCEPTVITVTEATTLTVTGECVVPTSYTTESLTETVTPEPTVAAPSTVAETSVAETSVASSSVAPEVSSFEGAGAKNVAGAFAGVAAVAAALL